ncbi:MAG: 1,4-alpha-glucan branching protein GlgB [Spirochaetes bacterium]|nr:1,4-alpha-glucan branching protein GlgB [Spirochaetota bacterium]
MKTQLSQEQIDLIVHSNHWNPSSVLGYHEITINQTKTKAVRVFLPEALDVKLTDAKNTFQMEKIHTDGLYEVIDDRIDRNTYFFEITNWENHTWKLEDSYKFLPILSDFDLHLFYEGNHFHLYEKFGAHLIEHEGVKGVHFAVWAPNAKRVSVIGNFNRWDGRHNPMNNRGSSGVWELFIPQLTRGEIYKYEIKTQDNRIIEKADPFAFYSELRPKTASIVYDINQYHWQDQDFMKKRDKTNFLSQPVSIYEVHLGSWKRKNGNELLNYRELAKQLVEYVNYLGYTHIELLPVTEHPFDLSWGYQVTGYYSPTSRFGTPDDFRYFVDLCHQNNIGVIMDWVPAHFPTDEFALARFDGSALYEHEDPKKGFHQDWATYIFNYGRNEVANFLVSNALFWLEHYHIDGLRVDAVASMLYLDYARKFGDWIPNQYGGNENLEAVDFIKKLNELVYSRHPGILMIAEESTAWAGVSRPTYLGGLGFGLKWNMGWMNDFLHYIEKEPIHRKYHHNNLTFSMIYAYNENFVLVISHDEVVHGKKSLIDKMPGDNWQKFANLRLALGFMYAHPGKKLLFMGSEFAQWKEWDVNYSLDWHLTDWDSHKQIMEYIKHLNLIYKKTKALYEIDYDWQGFEWVNANDWENSVISFLRKGTEPKDVILFVGNFTPVVRHNYRVGVPLHCHWEEFLNSDSEIYGGSGKGNFGGFWSDEIGWDNQSYSLNLTLPPLAVTMFKPKI